MPFELVVDKVDTLPANLQSLYVEREGKFHFDPTKIPDVTNLQTALKSEREKAAAHEANIKAWAKLGKAPAEVEAMLESERKDKEAALLKAGKFDEVLAQHLGNAKQERDQAVGAAQKEREAALGIARKALTDTNVTSSLSKAKATAEGMALLPRILGERVKIEFGEGGSVTESILDADGKTPMVGSGKGGLATYDDLVKEAIKNYPSLFEGTGAGGGGASSKGGAPGSKTISRADFDKLDPHQRHSTISSGVKVVD